MSDINPESVQWIRYMWIATFPDGKVISQFNQEGQKTKWDLTWKPSKVSLVPFSKDLALKVRSNAKIPALETETEGPVKPVTLEDFGQGIIAGQDQRYHTKPSVKCLTCGHVWPYVPDGKAECPNCHVKDEFFCTECQATRTPFVENDKILCPECKRRGKTRGLKRIMKFQITQSAPMYVTHYWIRSPPVEVRIEGEDVITRPLKTD